MNNKSLKTSVLFAIRLIFTGLVLTLCTLSLKAQQDTIVPVKKDPEKILRKTNIRNFTHNGFNFWYDKFSGHWAGIDFGFNMLVNPDYTGYSSEFMENDVFRSNTTYLNIIQQSIGLQKNRNTIGLVTGLGLQLKSYRLERNTTIQRLDNGRIEPQTLYFDHNQKSKLSVVSIVVPLLAEFQIPVNHYKNRLFISGGAYGGIRIDSHTKIKYRADGKKEKLKTPGHYSLQDFSYGLMIRTGYRWINLFATYDLVPLFKEDKGPELTPVTFGITLISF
ncbi:Outer membrane protein beta-barrel domain-containing protein [Mariniphaga anaerophila]|uniref:Outer membrane protein beta-barrel domain-containing protein n=1 Tax=Mariniphaga anaerophila TaxID=1484053 RepID=A0A1M5EH46_9BACT|nr:outer membrane beta-barrel protein [Mariniphaga anaerophila]SHF78568.1 Outer membrane protein beta-barrel domain-containing protein [Mariniphaga anaerophila]